MEKYIAFVIEQWLLVSVFLALVFLYFWNEKRRSGKSITTHEATRLINADSATLVDLREGKDFKVGHISNAINIPYAKLNERTPELEAHKQKTLILVDKMGQHTGAAGRELIKQGYQVARLEGGMTEWLNQKLPIVK